MAISLDKLPRIITLEEYGGNYQAYIDAIYDVFFRDFIQHKATFGTNKLNLRFKPLQQNRAYAFYHMTHVGEDEDNRLPDLRRCERMPWARPTTEQAEEMGLKFWEQDRRNGRRICIWLEAENNENYFVVLSVRKTYVLLLTAFYGNYPNYAAKREKEYQTWKKKVGRDFTPDELVKDIMARIPDDDVKDGSI